MRGRATQILRGARVPWRLGLDALGIALAVAYALPSTAYPFGIDQPIHYYIGRRLLDGEMPYASGISTKPPGVFLVHAASVLAFGDRQLSIRLVDLLFVLATGFLVATFRAHRRLRDGRVVPVQARAPGAIGAACLLAAGLYYTYFDFADTGHPDLWQGVFMLAPAWMLARSPDGELGPRRAFVAGALACAAVSFKHVAFISGLTGGVALVAVALARRRPRVALRDGALFSAGVFAVLGLVLLAFWVTGTFDRFWEIMVVHILSYAEQAQVGEPGPALWLTWRYGLSAVVGAVGLLVAGLAVAAAGRNRRARATGVLIALMLAGAAWTVVVQRRVFVDAGFTYHLIVLVPFLALAAAWGLGQRFGSAPGRSLATAVVLVAVAFWLAPETPHRRTRTYPDEWASWWAAVRGEGSWTEHHDAHDFGPLEAYVPLEAVAAHINARSRPGDTLCVDGFIAILYQRTGLRCPSRFFITDMVGDVPAWHDEWWRTIDETPPTFFVTFPRHPHIRQLEQRGYRASHVRPPRGPGYVVLMKPRPGEG